jgi:hypothetical protein
MYFGGVVSALAETETLEVITLNHQPAETLIPLIEPLVGDTGVVTGRNNQLILRTTPDRLTQIRTLLKQLDTPRQRLLISVQQIYEDQDQQQTVSVSKNVSLGSDPSVIDNKQQRVDVELEKRTAQRGDNLHQQIQVLNGSEAFLQVGETIPYAEQVAIDNPVYSNSNGHYSNNYAIGSKPVTSGFYVRPQVHGDWVTLEIAPHRAQESAQAGGRITKQQVATTVTGRLGEWLEVSKLDVQNQRNDQAIVRSTQRIDQTNRRILVKIDRLQ